ncbi:D-alanyl-D-alanine carboxypeptidase family protein [Traorella massiliensis]|uniref:D-alanyl-D-alanine carboxypeptidase family protein n=1 Tax=Traorella massiliensis TaxID=1903263 RepID=UPI0008F8F955|nr:D-alanyl-D-alanine carboxypeptidase family protein [Traorella massiliensis]
MKKVFILFLCFFCFSQNIRAEEDLTVHAQSAYLIEATTGKVLYDKNGEEKLFPASMTKMMSLILVYEALNDGSLKLDEVLSISENAASMGGSQVFLQPNEQMNVHDLLKAVCISSANDAMVAIAERISGSVSEFVSKMNEKSKELNLVNTNFENTTGLHDENHYSSAKDMALIAKKLIEVGKDDLLSITSTYDAYIREDTNPFWLVNTNKLVKHVEGVDGLKTGFTQEALSCITVTARKNDLRLIGVVMKEPDSKTRNVEVMEMINVGFSKIIYQPIFKMNDIYQSHYFEVGLPHEVDLVYLNDVGVILNKDEKVTVASQTFTQTRFDLPLEAHEKIGEVKIIYDDQSESIVDVGVAQSVSKMQFLDYFQMSFWRVLT